MSETKCKKCGESQTNWRHGLVPREAEQTARRNYHPFEPEPTPTPALSGGTRGRIAEIEARVEKATPGPWEPSPDGSCVVAPCPCCGLIATCQPYGIPSGNGSKDALEHYNSAFIAHAREDIPWLLAQLASAGLSGEGGAPGNVQSLNVAIHLQKLGLIDAENTGKVASAIFEAIFQQEFTEINGPAVGAPAEPTKEALSKMSRQELEETALTLWQLKEMWAKSAQANEVVRLMEENFLLKSGAAASPRSDLDEIAAEFRDKMCDLFNGNLSHGRSISEVAKAIMSRHIPAAQGPRRMICQACCTEVCEHGYCPNCRIPCKLCALPGSLPSPAPQQTRFDNFDVASHPANIWWQKHGQFMMSGGSRRQFIWACRGWIAREQLAEGVEVTGDSLHENPSLPSVNYVTEVRPSSIDWEALLFEYGDRYYASAENRLSDVGMVANAQRRKELHAILLAQLVTAPPQAPSPAEEK